MTLVELSTYGSIAFSCFFCPAFDPASRNISETEIFRKAVLGDIF